MSASRTLDVAEGLLAELFEEGYPAHYRHAVVRALDNHAAAECAKMRAAKKETTK